ncbi:hypothetical protein EJK55_1734 [Moraxella catarrhalis]|uniref:Uncharacterized protein n=1 Tax=Moraxella catarrhalis TaxID=480 RepID=A0A3Q9GF36_MORCA|nr:hypothetical protein MCR_1443 [Moraxella catarrhalis BBH18]AZQ94376.1 hypothetical protein EJK53_1764 [Moraxella catarrhalis]RUO16209.1 hypothetical protein EJK55_1734 [Moraxella catarrhalis]
MPTVMVFSKGLQNKKFVYYIISICQCHFVNINLMHVLDNFGLFYQ